MTSSDDETPNEEQQQQWALMVWRAYGRHVCKIHGLGRSFFAKVRNTFERTIIWRFVDAVLEEIPEEERTGPRIAPLIGVDKTTPWRWVRKEKEKRSPPSLRDFLFLAAAKGVDFSSNGFPRVGHSVLNGYCGAFDDVATKINHQRGLTEEEAACLYHITRNWKWLCAMRDASAETQECVALDILRNMSDIVEGDVAVHDAKDIHQLLARCMRPWAVIETVIQYEWFG